MVILVAVGRVLLLLVLALLTLSLVVALGRPETGVVEDVVMLAMIAGCLLLAVKLEALVTRVRGHLQGR